MFENLECSQPVFYVIKYFLKITLFLMFYFQLFSTFEQFFLKKNSQWKTSENNLKQLEYVIKKHLI